MGGLNVAEDKRANPFPYPTAAEFEASEGTREQKAARCIAARRFGGIPTRAFLLGGNDHSPVMKGILDFTTAVYDMLDAIDGNSDDADLCHRRIEAVREMMEDHGCPTSQES
jgi:hypothetical protein